jgi:hypothetical protein
MVERCINRFEKLDPELWSSAHSSIFKFGRGLTNGALP